MRKKVRGQSRRLKRLLKNIENMEPSFDYADKYEHFHVPCGPWLSRFKTSGKVKTEFCRKWLEKTQEIIASKPSGERFCKVVAEIAYPCFWDSQIIIFYDFQYYQNFFDRKGPYQIWTPISSKSFLRSRGIKSELKEMGFTEILNEEDEIYKSQLWFYGEI